MRILFVLENHFPNIGGVETLFKSLTEALAQKGHQVTVLTNRYSKELSPRETINKVEIIRPSFYNRYAFTLFGVFPVFKLAKDHDLIHTTSYNAGLTAIIGGKLRGKKVIITFHEVWADLWFRLPYFNKIQAAGHFLFEKMLLKLPFQKYIGVSEFTAKKLVANGVAEKKVLRIYNGIDYSEFEDASDMITANEEPFEFLYFGRLGISKGLNLLLEAFLNISQVNSACTLTLILPKDPKGILDRIQSFIARESLGERVRIIHSLPFSELQQRIRKSSAIVIPSYSEGFCFAAVESMALNAPVISSGQGALAEVVSGKHIVMDEMTTEGLVKSMQRALKGQWDETAKKEFHLKDSISEYLSLYQSLLEHA